MKCRLVVLVFGLVAFGSTALADDSSHMYVGVDAGRSKMRQDENVCNAEAAFSGATITDCKAKAWGYRAFVGYQFNPYLGMEGGYYDSGKFDFSGSAGAIGANGDAHAKIGDLDAVGIIPLTDNFELFAKLGIARWLLEESMNAAVSSTASEKGWSATVGVGANF